jgi:hypothetical protein
MRRRYLVVEDHAVMLDVIRHGVLSIDPSAEITWVRVMGKSRHRKCWKPATPSLGSRAGENAAPRHLTCA